MNQNNNKDMQAVRQWIEEGKPCFKIYGFQWKGANARPISQEEATALLDSGNYSFGMGYYELRWTDEGLRFCEYSESDMF